MDELKQLAQVASGVPRRRVRRSDYRLIVVILVAAVLAIGTVVTVLAVRQVSANQREIEEARISHLQVKQAAEHGLSARDAAELDELLIRHGRHAADSVTVHAGSED